MHRHPLPDSLEDRPITLSVWLVGAAIVAFLLAMLL